MKHERMVGYIYWHEIGMHDNITLVGETCFWYGQDVIPRRFRGDASWSGRNSMYL